MRSVGDIHLLLRDKIYTFFQINPVQVGGEEIIVHIDESKFNLKPKYQRGRSVGNEIWVFGIVDCTESPGVSYLECVPNRRVETLIPIIQRVCLEEQLFTAINLLLISD